MSYEKRSKKRLRKKTLRLSLILFIIFYFIFRSVPIIIAKNAKTILPEEGILIEKAKFESIIIKNEKVYEAYDSSLDFSVEEGKRVAAGVLIGSSKSGNISYLKKELEDVENAILTLSKSDKDRDILNSEKVKISEQKEDLIEDIQNNIALGKLGSINEIKGNVSLYNEKLNQVSFEKTLLGQGIDSLNQKKQELQEEIEKNNTSYYTQNSGIVSYKLDGYEQILIPKDFNNYTFDNLKIPEAIEEDKNHNEKVTIDNMSTFKLINGVEWFLAIKIPDINSIKSYELYEPIDIEFEDMEKELRGTIISINTDGNKSVLIVKFNTHLHEFYDLRFANINIIESKRDSLIVPTELIIEKDNQKGVYIKEINGIVKFRPIVVLGTEGDYTFVDKGNENRLISLSSEEDPVRTISLYDEIFINPNKIKEGQILN